MTDRALSPGALHGTVDAIASKSLAHRLLICAAFADAPTTVACNTTSDDIMATASCLAALGAKVRRTETGFDVVPVSSPVHDALLDCGESGSTLRFMLPVAAALACGARLTGHGRLSERPLSPLYEELCDKGVSLGPQGTFPLSVGGRIHDGRFRLPGNVSSQFVSGLLLAAPLMRLPVEVLVREPVQSRPYIALTVDALARFRVRVAVSRGAVNGCSTTSYKVFDADSPRAPEEPSPSVTYRTPGSVTVEGDWSNAAFWLVAGALGGDGITVRGLSGTSSQGDRAIADLVEKFGAHVEQTGDEVHVTPGPLHGIRIDATDIPDLVPPLAVMAGLAQGQTIITGVARLRLKESDRIATVSAALEALGGRIVATDDQLVITGVGGYRSCEIDAAGDHRIAMMGAIAATRADGPVTIRGAECVSKSYERFFDDFARLGGHVGDAIPDTADAGTQDDDGSDA